MTTARVDYEVRPWTAVNSTDFTVNPLPVFKTNKLVRWETLPGRHYVYPQEMCCGFFRVVFDIAMLFATPEYWLHRVRFS